MDVLSLILACSLYPDDQLVRVLIHVASQENPYFVGDAKTLARLPFCDLDPGLVCGWATDLPAKGPGARRTSGLEVEIRRPCKGALWISRDDRRH